MKKEPLPKEVTSIRCCHAQSFDGRTVETIDKTKDSCELEFHATGVEVITKRGTHLYVPLSSIKTVYFKIPTAK